MFEVCQSQSSKLWIDARSLAFGGVMNYNTTETILEKCVSSASRKIVSLIKDLPQNYDTLEEKFGVDAIKEAVDSLAHIISGMQELSTAFGDMERSRVDRIRALGAKEMNVTNDIARWTGFGDEIHSYCGMLQTYLPKLFHAQSAYVKKLNYARNVEDLKKMLVDRPRFEFVHFNVDLPAIYSPIASDAVETRLENYRGVWERVVNSFEGQWFELANRLATAYLAALQRINGNETAKQQIEAANKQSVDALGEILNRLHAAKDSNLAEYADHLAIMGPDSGTNDAFSPRSIKDATSLYIMYGLLANHHVDSAFAVFNDFY